MIMLDESILKIFANYKPEIKVKKKTTKKQTLIDMKNCVILCFRNWLKFTKVY